MDSIAIAALVLVPAMLALPLTLSFLRAKRVRRRFQILTEIAAVSDAGGSLPETLDAICAILVPEFADFCMVDVLDERDVERVAVRVGPDCDPKLGQGLAARKPSLPKHMVADTHLSELKPRVFERMSDVDLRGIAHDEEDLALLRSLGIRSAITVALRARGKLTGALTVGVAWSGRRYRRDDAEFANVLSGRVALSLDNAGLFSDLERAERAKAEIAETLQHGLLPPPLPPTPGWSPAAMYRPAGAENEVGGDFYDAFPVAEGWMLAIGDVTGHGARAASVAAQARYTLRTAAALTGNPLVALSTLNRTLLSRRESTLCSVALIVLDKDPFQPIRMAVAGHPPPLLVAGESVIETAPAGPMLGVSDDASWTIEQVRLTPGQLLVVVTDGITEACGAEGRFGEERLRVALAGAGSPVSAVQRLEAALHSFVDRGFDDDAAILAISPAPTEVTAHGHEELVERLFDAFNRRDAEGIDAVCHEEIEFFAVATAEKAGRVGPYTGSAGLSRYLDDVAQVWEELLVTATEIQVEGDRLLVRGRGYLRSREQGIRDMPGAWIWTVRDGRFIRGEVFVDPAEAVLRFIRGSASEAPDAAAPAG